MSSRPTHNQATSNRPDRQLHLLVALIAALAAVLSLAAVSAASVGAATPPPADDVDAEHRTLLADIEEGAVATIDAYAPGLDGSRWCSALSDHAGDWDGFADEVAVAAVDWATSERGMFEFVGVIAGAMCPGEVEQFLASTG
jgi:hypothetical protein